MQKEDETLCQAWEHFKELLNFYPHHGFESWRLVSYFYEGLTPRERQFIEMMCNGDFLQKDPDEAIDFLNDLVEKAHIEIEPNNVESTSGTHSISQQTSEGIYHWRKDENLKLRLEELDTLKKKETTSHATPKNDSCDPCFVCNEVDHIAQNCPIFLEMKGVYEEHCNTPSTHKKNFSPYSDTSNLGWENDNQDHAQSQTSKSYIAHYHASTSCDISLDSTLQAFIDTQMKINQKFESLVVHVVEENKEVKS